MIADNKNEEINSNSFGSLIQCLFNNNGEIKGFSIKDELVQLMYIESEYDYKFL